MAKEFQCTSCGGNRVLCDAWVNLNDDEDVRTFDQTYCEDCDGECSVQEVDVDEDFRSFEMFSEQGNRLVAQIVKNAIAKELDWKTVYAQLHELAKHSSYGEATDTAVREIVYWAIGAEKREENFWV